jgi:hypothetical protein
VEASEQQKKDRDSTRQSSFLTESNLFFSPWGDGLKDFQGVPQASSNIGGQDVDLIEEDLWLGVPGAIQTQLHLIQKVVGIDKEPEEDRKGGEEIIKLFIHIKICFLFTCI